MEPLWNPWLQPVAISGKWPSAEEAKTSPNSCHRLPRVACDGNECDEGVPPPGDRLQLVDWELSRGGPLQCCTPVWISAVSVSTSTCSTVRVRRSKLVRPRRMPTACAD